MATVRMSAQDALWLTMDRPNNLMVVDGVVILGHEVPFDAVLAQFRTMVSRFPVLSKRPVREGGNWCWEPDPRFDITNHVSAVSLADGATAEHLQHFVGEQRSVPLDKDRPLWSAFLVSPVHLPDGRSGSAIVTRFHHAIADGVRLTQILLSMCEAVDGTIVPLVARNGVQGAALSPVDAATGTVAGVTRLSIAAMRSTWSSMGSAASTARQVSSPAAALTTAGAIPGALKTRLDSGISLVRHPDQVLNAFEDAGGPSHRSINDMSSLTKLVFGGSEATVWSGLPGRAKSVSWSPPMALATVKTSARAHGATVNDMLVSAVAGGLRSYLADEDAAVSEVVWMVPVNLKPFEDDIPEDLGNHFALVMLGMPLFHESPEERLAEIHRRMQRIKNSDEAVITFGVQRTMSMSPMVMAEFVTNFFANKAVGVLTNVPGPTGRMAFAGADVVQVMGFAPCSGNQPLTATIFTYDGNVTIGFAGDAGLVPDLPRLVGHVVAEVRQLTESSAAGVG
jgi:diacylglycerol O-acyltransferase